MNTDFWDNLPEGYERHPYNCFINLPEGLEAPRATDRRFSTEDLFPTILASIGVQIDGDNSAYYLLHFL